MAHASFVKWNNSFTHGTFTHLCMQLRYQGCVAFRRCSLLPSLCVVPTIGIKKKYLVLNIGNDFYSELACSALEGVEPSSMKAGLFTVKFERWVRHF